MSYPSTMIELFNTEHDIFWAAVHDRDREAAEEALANMRRIASIINTPASSEAIASAEVLMGRW